MHSNSISSLIAEKMEKWVLFNGILLFFSCMDLVEGSKESYMDYDCTDSSIFHEIEQTMVLMHQIIMLTRIKTQFQDNRT